jgi:hypothetical protein
MDAVSRRLATALSVAVVLAGGVALAQSDLIVDPWTRVLAGKAPAPTVPAAPEASKPSRADGWFDEAGPTAPLTPVVEPVAPASGELLTERPERAAPAAPSPAPAPIAEAPHPLHPSNWARVVPEIIDPWGPRRLAVYRDPLIVDPWQN